MQKKLRELSPAKTGISIQKPPRLSWGVVVFVLIASFFVIYGGVDIAERIFSGRFDTEASALADDPSVLSMNPDSTALSSGSAAVSQGLPHFTPERLRIPALAIDVSVEQSGLNGAGNMAAPKHYDTVAWYKLGSRPGESGTTVIAGHLNNSLGLSGVFEKLNTLPLGSEVIISGEGKEIRYIVREEHVYGANDAPTASIFSQSGPSRLILITCDGAWDAGVRSYTKRLVLTAEPI